MAMGQKIISLVLMTAFSVSLISCHGNRPVDIPRENENLQPEIKDYIPEMGALQPKGIIAPLGAHAFTIVQS